MSETKHGASHRLSVRDVTTVATIGTFIITGVTGLLMFFHLNTGLMKLLHEWGSWAFVAAVLAHSAVHWRCLPRLARSPAMLLVLALCAGTVALSAVPIGGRSLAGGPPVIRKVVQKFEQASLQEIAALVKSTPEEIKAQLESAGIQVSDVSMPLAKIAEQNGRPSFEVINLLLEEEGKLPANGGPSRQTRGIRTNN